MNMSVSGRRNLVAEPREQTMEEILASIRRIINETDAAAIGTMAELGEHLIPI